MLRRTTPLIIMLAAGCAIGQPKPAATPAAQPKAAIPAQSTSLTIYSTATPGAIPPEMYRPVPQSMGGGYNPYQGQPVPGYAVIRQERTIPIAPGRSVLKFLDVAALIDPTTVAFTDLTDSGTRVLEQNYQFDLVGQPKLLERYIDKEITVQQNTGDGHTESFTGTLLSSSGGWLILRGPDGKIRTTASYNNIVFPALPEGLITRPTLVWDVEAERGGDHRARVSYQTTGMTWWADYNIVFADGKDANSGTLDLGAWVSIINQSGAGYPDAALKLIAGDVQRASPQNVAYPAAAMEDRLGMRAGGTAGFQEKSFFEYHLYTLGRPTTLPDNSTKQIELFPAAHAIPCDKVLLYYGLPEQYRGFWGQPMMDRAFGTESNNKVDVYLRFKNEEKVGLGVPLPSGRIRVSKLDPADQSLEFIGEDVIDHTPKDEEVLIKLGSAFDVVGERIQKDFRADYDKHWMEEDIQIKLRNHKAEPVNVIVKENLYRWTNWEVLKPSTQFEKVDSRTIHFPVTVEKDGETTVTYTVRYTW